MKKILLVLFATLITSTVFSQIPTANLLAWYPFCGDTTDHSGSGTNLLVTSLSTPSPVLTTDRFGNANTAYLFRGVNSLMRTSTFFSAAGDFSYSCWVNVPGGQSSSIIYEGNVTSNGFGLVMNNGTIGSPGDSVSLLFGGIGQFLSTPITLNQWHNLVFTRSGDSYQLYVDTTLIGSFVNFFLPLTSSDVFNVGYDYASSSNAFKGTIDDIAVYSKQLSLTEVKALYNFNPDVPLFTLGNDTAICSNSIVFSQSVAPLTGNYLCGTGDTTTTDTVTPPVFPGAKYWLAISVPYGCVNSDTINIRHITTSVKLGDDTTFCAGNTLVLNSRVAGETYTWSTGDTTATIAVNTAGTYWLDVDSLGCFGTDTISITLNPQPSVNLGPDTASCLGNPVTLQASVSYTGTMTPTYVWGAIPVLTAPSASATIVASVTGTYWVTVTQAGCPNSDTIHVLVVSDTFTFNEPRDTGICTGTSFATNVTINPNIAYQWRPTTGMPLSNIADPTITTTVSATYVLTATYTVTTTYVGCPVIVDSFHLDIQPNPIVDYFGQPRSVCLNDTLHITGVVEPASYSHYTYTWTPGVSLDDPTASTVVFTAGDSTNLILTVTTPAGCTGKDSIQINVHPIDFASITAPHPICPGDSIQLSPTILVTPYPTTATFEWFPSFYLSDPNSSSPWVHAITTQDYMLVGTSQFGCFDTLNVTVVVHPAATLYMEDSTVLYPGESYHITPQTNCQNFTWSPTIGLNDPYIADPTAIPPTNTVYSVVATTEWGCVTTDSIKIRVFLPYSRF